MSNVSKFSINYSKAYQLDLSSLEQNFVPSFEDIEHNYNAFRINVIQNYNPTYELFFSLNEKTFNTLSLNHQYQFVDMYTIRHVEKKKESQKSTFIKYSPLLDPVRYMIGKYKTNDDSAIELPTLTKKTDSKLNQKLSDSNNASYVDNFFSYLTSKLLKQHRIVNGLDYYGSYLAIQEKFKVNITDDLEYLNGSTYFKENLNKLYTVTSSVEDEFANFSSRTNKHKLRISDSNANNISISNISVEDLDIDTPDENIEELVYENNGQNQISDVSSETSSDDSDDNYSIDSNNKNGENKDNEDKSDDESWETESEDSSDVNTDEENHVFSYINNFPTQLICLEKCDGTFDELFVRDKINPENGASALMQVIMTLIAYQKAFNFTHNDLHTNNIMFINTDIEFLYYRYNKSVYKIPTYGKIFKIIDFGRSVYKFNGRLFFSDSFAPGGDAATQYNCEPYMNTNKPRIDPNYSFDLCRLGSSIYDFIIEDDSDKSIKEMDDLQKTIYRWCLDDNDKNVLYKKDGEERYPNFKLYKMIARNVHKHTPQEQLKFPFFKQFLVTAEKNMLENIDIIDLDSLPTYI